MTKPGEPECDHDRRWSAYTQEDIAEAINVKKTVITEWVRDGLPRTKAGKNRHRYCIPCILAWKDKRRSPIVAIANPEDDLEVTGGDSPGLERYRLAKAALAELDLEQRRGQLVSVERVKEGLLRVATIIRRLGERLGKRYGNDATIAVNETVDEIERAMTANDRDASPNTTG